MQTSEKKLPLQGISRTVLLDRCSSAHNCWQA